MTSEDYIGLACLLQIVLFAFKLAGVINWSWWLVSLPTLLWVGICFLVGIVLATIFILRAIYELIKNKKDDFDNE